MTHVKNVEAFEGFVGSCTGFGDKYNPGLPKLRLDALSVLLVNARKALASVHEKKTDYDRVTNEREVFFRDIPRLAASVILTLDASGVKAETLHDAKGFYRLLLGRRAKVKALEPTPEGEMPARSPRVAQLSYESKTDHFARLVQLVSTSPNYAVNEPELSVPGLKATVKKMYSLNSAVVKARVALGNARITRNETLYSTDEAIYMVGRSARKYVRAIFGQNSEEFRQVRRFVFTKPRAR
ncbi:MAG: hypothetical protein KDC99_17205 [Cyclobacteriaceae bacterium]|nr:hypothetical protein [Cyclobacteriaceae bacterium]